MEFDDARIFNPGAVMNEVSNETELSFIAYLVDPESLKDADRIAKIKQYMIRVPEKEGSYKSHIRVRETNLVYPGSEIQHHLTIKTELYSNTVTASKELTTKISPQFFAYYSTVAESGSFKTRYTFKIKNPTVRFVYNNEAFTATVPFLNYEVDVFNIDDFVSNWVKIDVEIDHVLSYIDKYFHELHGAPVESIGVHIDLSELPCKLAGAFNSNVPNDSQKAIKDALYGKEIFAFKLP
jgi:hypothetical protein